MIRTPAPRLPRRSLARLAALALLAPLAGCAPRGGPAEFDADAVPEAYARSTGALMWPGATRAFRVTPEGDLDNGAWRLRIAARDGSGEAGAPRAIAAEDRWMPVLHWTRETPAARYDFEAVAVPAPAPRDSALLVSVTFRARAKQAAECGVEFSFGALGPDSVIAAWDFEHGVEDAVLQRWIGPRSGGAGVALSDRPAGAGTARWSWKLAAGASASGRAVLSTYARPAATLAAAWRTPHEALARRTREFWRGALAAGTSVALSDPEVENAISAARVILLACGERRAGGWMPIGGPFQYRDIWIRDGARAVAALAMYGHTAEARDRADGLLRFQWPSGAILSQRGQLDGTGQAVWAAAQAHLRPATGPGAAAAAERALRAWRWGERQRALPEAAGWPFGRMLPFAEPRDNERVRAQLVGNDAWMIAGYESAGRLLRATGRAREADSVAASRRAYVAEFVRALERTGSPDVPPSWQGIGHDWGNANVGYPCRVLADGDARLARLARRLWRDAGGPGLGYYAVPDSLHSYDFADLATWAMRVGLRREADAMLDSLLRWRSASGGAAELFSRSARDYGVNAPPHPTAAAVLLATVRNAVLYDDADTLALTAGARERWWRGSEWRGAPTRWGSLDVDFERRGSAARWRWTPVPVWTLLTLPPGATLAAPPAAPLVASGRTRVLAPPGTGEARVALSEAAP